MDLYEAISARRNVHKYKAEEVPQDKLKKVLVYIFLLKITSIVVTDST